MRNLSGERSGSPHSNRSGPTKAVGDCLVSYTGKGKRRLGILNLTGSTDERRDLENPSPVDRLAVDPIPQAVVPQPKLFACPDCGHQCSTQAESCPTCGRFFRQYSRVLEVIPGAGWIGKVALGIVVSSFLWGAILTIFFVVGVFILAILMGVGSV